MSPLNTIKRLGVLLLMIALLLQSFSRVLIIGDYYLNTESYAAHCENKANPIMHCNGKCQMAKKLKQAYESEKADPNKKIVINNEFYCLERYSVSLSLIAFDSDKQSFSLMHNPKIKDFPHSIFKPPTV